jgi:catechol 2,3-dioxygenase-like lactoylglutathione lyase family enzyme
MSNRCLCCGNERAESELAHPAGNSEAVICRGCLGWLSSQVASRVTAVFPTRDIAESKRFYASAGFDLEAYDEGYVFVMRDGGELLHLVSAPELDPQTNRAACYIHCSKAEVWHEEWSEAGLPVSLLEDRPWGMREFSVIDPSGNLLRVGRNL